MPRRPHRSNQAAKLFAALAAHPDAWQHGYDLMRQTRLASGTLYPLLIRLHEAGYLEARWEEPVMPARAPRHAYRRTASGVAFGRALLAERKMDARHRLREKLA